MLDFTYPRYKVERDPNQCIQCGVCARQCANEVHMVDTDLGRVVADHKKCVNCQRCVVMCPTNALAITNWPQVGNGSNNWNLAAMQDIAKQAQTGAVLLSSMAIPSIIRFTGIICCSTRARLPILPSTRCASPWRPVCFWAAVPRRCASMSASARWSRRCRLASSSTYPLCSRP